MNDNLKALAKSTQFSLDALEAKLGAASDETKKMQSYLKDIHLMADDRLVSDILTAVQLRIDELNLEFSVRDTDPIPPSET